MHTRQNKVLCYRQYLIDRLCLCWLKIRQSILTHTFNASQDKGLTQHSGIDIVYLWVDGADHLWQAKRQQAIQGLNASQVGSMAAYSNVAGRYRDNNELRYNLRALDKYFPDHGHIYIVTDAQQPAWLKPSAGLSIVDHHDLIPPLHLPTYDSGNIESYIHRIPNLSERFIYLNDDVFFGGPVNINDWFFEGGVYTVWSSEPLVEGLAMQTQATALVNASRWSQQWFLQQRDHQDPSIAHLATHYQHTPRTFAHAPRAMTKTIMQNAERIAPELFTAVRSTVFRVWDKPTIVSDFVLRWALETQQARIVQRKQVHVSTGHPSAEQALNTLKQHMGALSFFCINDTLDDADASDPRLAAVSRSLQMLFPDPSPFER